MSSFLLEVNLEYFYKRFFVSLGLIMTIGAQNAYVLKRSLLKESVFAVAFTFALIDAFLIIAGVKRLNKFIEAFPSFITYITWFGILLLTAYGFLALKSTFTKQIMDISPSQAKNLYLGLL